jgi:hypothetical protein
VESDTRFFQRRAQEELAAARRAVTAAARDRRMQLADIFFRRFEAADALKRPSDSGNKAARQELREDA